MDQLGPSDSKVQIDVLDIVGDIAAVRVTMEDSHGTDYVDFHVLKKTEEGWKTADKVFTEKQGGVWMKELVDVGDYVRAFLSLAWCSSCG